ncbi:MAG: efflux RND transporter periplasmic adaptor subunit, partial [Akkermansiaceae bacterium]
AQAEVERAIRDLDRTKLRAPYACRVEAIFTDLGSYVAPGARLADLYSVDELELRLPVPLEDFAYLTEQANEKSGAIVHAHARLGGADRKWVANISRSEGQVDRNTMMVHLVARLKPNKKDKAFPLPPVGLFMQGRIEGKMIKGVFSIPRSALRHDNTILVLKKDNTLAVKTVELARTLDTTVLISGGLEEGEQIITSPLETPVPGMKLTTVEKAAEKNSEESNK